MFLTNCAVAPEKTDYFLSASATASQIRKENRVRCRWLSAAVILGLGSLATLYSRLFNSLNFLLLLQKATFQSKSSVLRVLSEISPGDRHEGDGRFAGSDGERSVRLLFSCFLRFFFASLRLTIAPLLRSDTDIANYALDALTNVMSDEVTEESES